MTSISIPPVQAVEVWLDDRQSPKVLVGVLKLDQEEQISFQYADAWLSHDRAFALGPELPLETLAMPVSLDLTSVGVFRDACPDRWGRMLMEMQEALEARVEQREPRQLRDWDFLLGTPDLTRQGAFRFRLPGTKMYLDAMSVPAPPSTDLRRMALEVLHLSTLKFGEAESSLRSLNWLTGPGASLGGSRPKVNFTAVDGTPWMAKFPAHDDEGDIGAWEYLLFRLAKGAGLDVPETQLLKLGGKFHTLCIQRFDRLDGRRRIYASAPTLLHKTNFGPASYLDIAFFIDSKGSPNYFDKDLDELFRRCAFNIAVGHRYDRMRKHAFLRNFDGWQLAPAFGMFPSIDRPRHSMNIDASDNWPSLDTVLETAPSYGLTGAAANAIVAKVVRAVRRWEIEAKKLKISSAEIQVMKPAFAALETWSGRPS